MTVHDAPGCDPATILADPTTDDRLPTTATVGGACSYENCGCGGFVKDNYGGDCASCSHPANAHW